MKKRMKKRMHKILAVLVALVMLCGAVPLTAHAEDWPPANAVPIVLETLSGAEEVESEEDWYFSFTPSETGMYLFLSFASPSFIDSACNLYTADGELLQTGNTGGGINSFSFIDCSLTAGETYYFGVHLIRATGCNLHVYLQESSVAVQKEKDSLNALIKEAKETKRLWISADKWLALQKAIQTAQAVADDPNASFEQFDAQYVALKQAIDAATDFRDNEFNYKPGNFWRLFFEKSWGGYWGGLELISNLISFPFALIWIPVHFLLIGVTWVIGWFI